MNLVSERDEWYREAYEGGTQAYIDYTPYLDYCQLRSSELFRLPREMERFFEYVRAIETLLEENQDQTANRQ